MAQHQDTQAPGSVPCLLGLVGSLTDQQFQLCSGQILIGRDAAQCQIVLSHSVISRCHAKIELDGQGRATLTDLNSSQGTFVNGESVAQRKLCDGDRVGFGPGGMIAFAYRASAAPQGLVTPTQPAAPQNYSSPSEALRAQLLNSAQQAVTAGLSPAPTAPPAKYIPGYECNSIAARPRA